MSESLDAIGLRYATDKSSIYHHYLSRLEPYFAALPRPLRLLEIGVFHGRSIRMWLDYLPDSLIYGMDLECVHTVSDPRFTFHLGNAAEPASWSPLGTFHVVIDDGSHWSGHVKPAYELGFAHVEPGGLWIIEDTCKTDYDALELMRATILELQDQNRDWCGNPESGTSRFSFVHFLKGLIIIGKRA